MLRYTQNTLSMSLFARVNRLRLADASPVLRNLVEDVYHRDAHNYDVDEVVKLPLDPGATPAVVAVIEDLIANQEYWTPSQISNRIFQMEDDGDKRCVFNILDKYELSKSLEAMESRIAADITQFRSSAKDVLSIYDRHPRIVDLITNSHDNVVIDSLRHLDSDQLKRIIISRMPPPEKDLTAMLVLVHREDNPMNMGMFRAGFVLFRVQPPGEDLVFPRCGPTREWLLMFSDLYTITDKDHCWMVIDLPAGHEYVVPPLDPSLWISDAYWHATDEDDIPDRPTTLANVCRAVTFPGRVELVMGFNGQDTHVLYRSGEIEDHDLNESMCM